MREHGALGKTCGAGSVLNVDDFVHIKLDICQRAILLTLPHPLHLLVSNHARRSLLSEENHMAQKGKFGAVELALRVMLAQLWSDLVYDVDIVHVAKARVKNESAGLRLRQEIFNLMLTQKRVDRDHDGAYLGQGEKEDHPFRQVR